MQGDLTKAASEYKEYFLGVFGSFVQTLSTSNILHDQGKCA